MSESKNQNGSLKQIERLLCLIDDVLRSVFPSDFQRRCAYAAIAVKTALEDAGQAASIVAGDFCALVVQTDSRHASLQGYAFGSDQESHFWVETQDRIIDLGLFYLPLTSSFGATAMPALAWPLSEPLPSGLQYRERQRLPGHVMISDDRLITQRSEQVIALMRDKIANARCDPRPFPTWLATGHYSLQKARYRHDIWAMGLSKFEKLAELNPSPLDRHNRN